MYDLATYSTHSRVTPSTIKYAHETNHSGYFFTRGSMRFSRDTMRGFGCCRVVGIERDTGNVVDCWLLYRRNPTKLQGQLAAYFDTTGKRLHNIVEHRERTHTGTNVAA